MSSRKGAQSGFALPTVVIASVMLFTMLVAAVSATTSVRSAIDSQIGDQLAREAIDAGLAYAHQCLEANEYNAQWTDAKPLRPWTDCYGNPTDCSMSSLPCYLVDSGRVRTGFVVKEPDDGGVAGAPQTIPVTADTEMSRKTLSQGVAKRFTESAKGRTGNMLSVDNVFFGYTNAYPGGSDDNLKAFFITKTGDGGLKGAGYNSFGQLSVGTTNAVNTIPRDYMNLPSDKIAKKVFTQFKSGDLTTFVLMSDGSLYGAGDNTRGTLSVNPAIPGNDIIEQAVKYNIANPVKTVFNNGHKAYVIDDTGRIYATGPCSDIGLAAAKFMAGNNCYTPQLIDGIPTPSGPDLSRKAADAVADGGFNLIMMEGGQLYGWGSGGGDLCRMLSPSWTSTPIRIGNFGDPGQPKVVKIDTDGTAAFALLDNGQMVSGGCNNRGQASSTRALIQSEQLHSGNPLCIDIDGGNPANGTPIQYWNCTNNVAQHWAFDMNYHIRNSTLSPGNDRCIDVAGGSVANGTKIQIWTCQSGNTNQEFVYRKEDWSIRLRKDQGKCLSAVSTPVTPGTDIVVWSCDGNAWQRWSLPPIVGMQPVNIPAGSEVKDMITDFASIHMLLDTDGDDVPDMIAGAGKNDHGQLGGGAGILQGRHPRLTRFEINTPGDWPIALTHTAHVGISANTMAVMASGRVFGSGSNDYGQLGVCPATPIVAHTPVQMGSVSTAKQARIGGSMSVVITNDNKVYTVGRNNYGQLGDGTTVDSCVPKIRKYTNPLPMTVY